MMSSKFIVRRGATLMARNQSKATRGMATTAARTTSRQIPLALVAGASTVLAFSYLQPQKTFCELPVISVGQSVEEPDTGIVFPPMVNGFTFMGCGVHLSRSIYLF